MEIFNRSKTKRRVIGELILSGLVMISPVGVFWIGLVFCAGSFDASCTYIPSIFEPYVLFSTKAIGYGLIIFSPLALLASAIAYALFISALLQLFFGAYSSNQITAQENVSKTIVRNIKNTSYVFRFLMAGMLFVTLLFVWEYIQKI